MELKSIRCPGIHCGHCTARIERELGALPGVTTVRADAETKQVTVQWDPPATWEGICHALEELGYPPESGS
jgi:copper chaperone